jgi:hypothetical protein
LCRSAADGKSCELIEAAYDRYVRVARERSTIEIWKANRQITAVKAGTPLRIQAAAPFLLHWTADEWLHPTDAQSTPTGLDIHFVDVPVPQEPRTMRFTFLWVNENRWEGQNYEIEVHGRAEQFQKLA